MTAPLRAGIIAAGEGSRLRSLSPDLPKPLVPVGGTPLCQWVVEGLFRAGVREFVLLHNSRGRAIGAHLRAAFPAARWTVLERDTASSWESFRLVSSALAAQGDFLMTTADGLIAPHEVAAFARQAAGSPAALAVTSYIDDEKPLFADVENGKVTALGADAKAKRYATSGLYFLSGAAAKDMPEAPRFGALREYWTDLVRRGVPVKGVVLSKTLDVDRPEDVRQAEQFVKEAAWSAPL